MTDDWQKVDPEALDTATKIVITQLFALMTIKQRIEMIVELVEYFGFELKEEEHITE